MRHTDRHGWGEGGGGEAITNDALKLGKVVKFESSCIVICFSCIDLIIDEKIAFIN